MSTMNGGIYKHQNQSIDHLITFKLNLLSKKKKEKEIGAREKKEGLGKPPAR